VALKAGVVQVSGRGINVDFTIDDSAPFDQVTRRLRQYLVENRALWSSGSISVNAGGWILSREQLGRIKQIIESESGLTVNRFWCSPDHLDRANYGTNETGLEDSTPKGFALRQADSEPAAAATTMPPKLKEPKSGSSSKGLPTEALFVKTTFRSGESIHYPGDVVVLSDVNPGAEILAEGDIVVFGSLRGLAHAGVAGDIKATIIALDLDSPRIQIGPYTGLTQATSPRSKSKATGPQIAYVRRRNIYVAPFAGRFARYSRGILYEG
jgi:septum site-determining protein MinC